MSDDRLAELVERRAGIVVPPGELPRLETRLAPRWRELGVSTLEGYLSLLEREQSGEEMRHLLSQVTVNESFLFRSPRQFELLREVVIPDLSRGAPERPLRVWSAGCARGEECVSLAVVLAETLGLDRSRPWTVTGTDIDEEALAAARTWSYGPRAIRQVPEELRERYFERQRERFVVTRAIRDRISYIPANLRQLGASDLGGPFQVVFLRNVLIYFRPEVQRSVVESAAERLAPGGYLFVGPSESLWSLGTDLRAHDLGGAFAYRRAGDSPASPTVRTTEAPRRPTNDAAMREQVVRAVAEHRDDQARELLERADCGRGDPTLQTARGLMAARAGEIREATRLYRAAVYLDPKLVQVRLLLADQLARRGRTGRAVAEYRTAVSLIERGNARALEGADELGLTPLDDVGQACRRALGNLLT